MKLEIFLSDVRFNNGELLFLQLGLKGESVSTLRTNSFLSDGSLKWSLKDPENNFKTRISHLLSSIQLIQYSIIKFE